MIAIESIKISLARKVAPRSTRVRGWLAREAAVVIEREHPDVQRVILYGSHARREGGRGSDIDLCYTTRRRLTLGDSFDLLHSVRDTLREAGFAVGMRPGEIHVEDMCEKFLEDPSDMLDSSLVEAINREGITLFTRRS